MDRSVGDAQRARLWRIRGLLGPRTSRPCIRVRTGIREVGALLLMYETGCATAGASAAALVLATSRHLASAGHFELGGEAVVVAVRGFRAEQNSSAQRRDA